MAKEWRRAGARAGTWAAGLPADRKQSIAIVCDRFIAEHLKPRFLPEIRPTEFNYPVDLFGRWRGDKYSFVTRYRSGFPDTLGEEFDQAFTRLEHVATVRGEILFDVMWHRHTGQWFRVFPGQTLDGALRLIESESVLQPAI